jgi:hypothetical protein
MNLTDEENLYLNIIDEIQEKKPDGLTIEDLIIDTPLGKNIQLNNKKGICSFNALCEILLFSTKTRGIQLTMYKITYYIISNRIDINDIIRELVIDRDIVFSLTPFGHKHNLFKLLLDATKRILLAYHKIQIINKHMPPTRLQLRNELSIEIETNIRSCIQKSEIINIDMIEMLGSEPFYINVHIRKFRSSALDSEIINTSQYYKKVVYQLKPLSPLKIITYDMYFMNYDDDDNSFKFPYEKLTNISSYFAILLKGVMSNSKAPHACSLIRKSENAWYFINNNNLYENINDDDAILLCMGKIIFVNLLLDGKNNLGIMHITYENEIITRAHVMYGYQQYKLELEIDSGTILCETINYKLFIDYIVSESYLFGTDMGFDRTFSNRNAKQMEEKKLEELDFSIEVPDEKKSDDEWPDMDDMEAVNSGKKRKKNKKVSTYKNRSKCRKGYIVKKTKSYRKKTKSYRKKTKSYRKKN